MEEESTVLQPLAQSKNHGEVHEEPPLQHHHHHPHPHPHHPASNRSDVFVYGDKYQKAAALVDLAEDDVGLPEEVLEQPNYDHAVRLYLIQMKLKFLWYLNLAALIVLNFFELPSWCKGSTCGNRQDYFLGQLPYLSRKESLIYEVITLVILIAHTFYPISYTGVWVFFKNRVDLLKVILVTILMGDIIVDAFYVIPSWPISTLNFRLAPYLRVLILLVHSRELRHCVYTLGRIVQVFFDISALLLLYILFSSWLAYVMFEDTKEGTAYFSSFGKTLYQMFILFTTSNNPDVWLPAYKQSRATSLFFVVYILFGVYFITNLILAVVYDSFKKQLAQSMIETYMKQKRILDVAFGILDVEGRGYLDKEQCAGLFEGLNKYRTMRKIEEENFEVIFYTLDDSGDFKINKEEFADLCEAITLNFPKAPQPSWLEGIPSCYNSLWSNTLKKFVKSRKFEYVVFGILLLNLVTVIIETTFDLQNSSGQHFWQQIELVFGWIYVVEMLLKIYSYSFDQYWQEGQNKFDFVVTLIIVVGETLTFVVPDDFPIISNEEWIRYLLVARLLRLARLLMLIERYRVIVSTFLKLIPSLAPYFGVLFCMMCLYCSLGIQLFGGLVYIGNSTLQETSLYENEYLLDNFNDYPNGMVTLFNLIVMGNWQVWMESYVTLAGSWWAVIYFISFYGLTILFILNLVIAFVLEAFFAERDLASQIEAAPVIASNSMAEQIGQQEKLLKARQEMSQNVRALLNHILSAELEAANALEA